MWLAYYQHFLVDQNRSDIHTKLNNTGSTKHGAVVVLLKVCMSFSFAVGKEERRMKESVYKSYEELPLFLNAEMVAKVLGVAPSTAYELMHEADFPTLKIGNRIVVPKEQFIVWVQRHTEGGVQ